MEILKRKGAKILVCQMARKDWKKRYTYTLRGKAKKKTKKAILAGMQQKQQRGQHYPAH